ncbi:MAG: DUF2892 domain-containing protein [bacterium]|nr:DUF2892 domain-containing protein [bacterium]
MKKNVGPLDRSLRLVIGLGLVALAVMGPRTPWGWSGLVPLLTAVSSWCPLYTLFGKSTLPRRPGRGAEVGRRVVVLATFASLAASLGAAPADALPRYSARYGQSCLLCHENPTGGGMRSAYAAEYLIPEELAAPSSPEARFSPGIGERVAVGADLRTLLYESDGERDGVLAMQADVYLSVRMDDRTSVHVERGARGPGRGASAPRATCRPTAT